MRSITIRVEDEIADKIDNLAKMQDRDRTYMINKAIKGLISHEEYIINKIYAGLQDIETGNTLSEEEFKNSMKEFMDNYK